jgi:hypothetical protein
MFVQMLDSFMVFYMTTGFVFAVVVVMMNVTSSLVLFHVMNHVLVLMLMGSFAVFHNGSVIVFHI